MQIVLDNIIYSKAPNGGVSNYWFELSRYLMSRPDDALFFFDEENGRGNFHRRQLDIPSEAILVGHRNPSAFLSRLSSLRHSFDAPFLYHSSFYRPLKGEKNYVEITTVHDFTHNFFAPVHKRMVHNKLKYDAIRRSEGIICISKHTRDDLYRFCPPARHQKVAVIYNGVSDAYRPLNLEKPDRKDFLLFVGARDGYKNFSFVTRLMEELPEMELVVVGAPFTIREQKAIGPDLMARTRLLSQVSNDDLNVLYNQAFAFVYPSLYEGFGIPVIEAMKAGCPVLALANSSIVEVAGDAGRLFDQADVALFRDELRRLAENGYRAETIEKGFEQSRLFSWEKCCRETHDFYQANY